MIRTKRVFGYMFAWEKTRKGTPWGWQDRECRRRYSFFLAVKQIYDRNDRAYAWAVILGPYQIVWSKIRQNDFK